jgi:hypothetical protein
MRLNTFTILISIYNTVISLLVVLFASYLHVNVLIAIGGVLSCMALFVLSPVLSAAYVERRIFKYMFSAPIALGIFIGFSVVLQPVIGLLLGLISFVLLLATAYGVIRIYKNQLKLDLRIIFERYVLTVFLIFAAICAAALLANYPQIEDKLIVESQKQVQKYFDNANFSPINIFGQTFNVDTSSLGIDTKVNLVVVQHIKDYSVYIIVLLSLVTLLGLGSLSRLLWLILGLFLNPFHKFLVRQKYYFVETRMVEKQILTRKPTT